MPITQTRIINILTAWQALVNQQADLKEDARFYEQEISAGRKTYEEAFLDLSLKIARAAVPQHELLTAEQVHFKANKQRNNYQQRRMARKRGKDGLGERYASDSILPNPAKLPPPQPTQLTGPPNNSQLAQDIERDRLFTLQHPETITPPDPDKLASAVKDIDPEDFLS